MRNDPGKCDEVIS